MAWQDYLTDDEREMFAKATIARDVNRNEYARLYRKLKGRAYQRSLKKRTEAKRDARP